MRIAGKDISDHIRLLRPLLGVVGAVWALRMLLAVSQAPVSVVEYASVTVAAALCVLLAVIMIHVRQFGSYSNVVMASFLLMAWAHLLVVVAILFSIVTGSENIYTDARYSLPATDPHHIKHILGHLTFGIGAETLLGAGVGSLLLWILRSLMPVPTTR